MRLFEQRTKLGEDVGELEGIVVLPSLGRSHCERLAPVVG